jgi:hypothetical protein
MDLDPHTDQRIRKLENWMPRADRRIADVERGLAENTRITADTNVKVTEMWQYWSAGKIGKRLLMGIMVVIGACGAAITAVIAWVHR